MRQIVAKRIHALMKDAGPTLTWRHARKMWFRMPKYRVGETRPKWKAPRRRAINKPWRRFIEGKRCVDHAPNYGPPILARQIYGHIAIGTRAGVGSRNNRRRGPRCMKHLNQALLAQQLAIKMGMQAVQRQQHRQHPKVYPSFSTRAMQRGVSRGR